MYMLAQSLNIKYYLANLKLILAAADQSHTFYC
jgi:hypothetical protein